MDKYSSNFLGSLKFSMDAEVWYFSIPEICHQHHQYWCCKELYILMQIYFWVLSDKYHGINVFCLCSSYMGN